jgi:hypothetical protein
MNAVRGKWVVMQEPISRKLKNIEQRLLEKRMVERLGERGILNLNPQEVEVAAFLSSLNVCKIEWNALCTAWGIVYDVLPVLMHRARDQPDLYNCIGRGKCISCIVHGVGSGMTAPDEDVNHLMIECPDSLILQLHNILLIEAARWYGWMGWYAGSTAIQSNELFRIEQANDSQEEHTQRYSEERLKCGIHNILLVEHNDTDEPHIIIRAEGMLRLLKRDETQSMQPDVVSAVERDRIVTIKNSLKPPSTKVMGRRGNDMIVAIAKPDTQWYGSPWWWDHRVTNMVSWVESMPDIGLWSFKAEDQIPGKCHWVEFGDHKLHHIWASDRVQRLMSNGAEQVWIMAYHKSEIEKLVGMGMQTVLVVPPNVLDVMEARCLEGKGALLEKKSVIQHEVHVMYGGSIPLGEHEAIQLEEYARLLKIWVSGVSDDHVDFTQPSSLLAKPRVVDKIGVWSVSLEYAHYLNLPHWSDKVGKNKWSMKEGVCGIPPRKMSTTVMDDMFTRRQFDYWLIKWMVRRWEVTHRYWMASRKIVINYEEQHGITNELKKAGYHAAVDDLLWAERKLHKSCPYRNKSAAEMKAARKKWQSIANSTKACDTPKHDNRGSPKRKYQNSRPTKGVQKSKIRTPNANKRLMNMVADEVNSQKQGKWMRRGTILETESTMERNEGSAPEFTPAVKRLALDLGKGVMPKMTCDASRRRSRVADNDNDDE